MNKDEYISKLLKRDIKCLETVIDILESLSKKDNLLKPNTSTSTENTYFLKTNESLMKYFYSLHENMVDRITQHIKVYANAALTTYHNHNPQDIINERINIINTLREEISSYQELHDKLN